MPKIKNNFTVKDYVIKFLEFCQYKNLRFKTIKSYQQSLMLFATWLEEEKDTTDIRKLTKEVVEEYITSIQERGKYSYCATEEGAKKSGIYSRQDIGSKVSPSTLNNYLRNIKVFSNWLKEEGILLRNDIVKCKFIKTQRKPKDQLSDEEYNRLIKAMDCSKFHEFRDYIITNLIMDTGMRLNECLLLNMEDIDILNRSILLISDNTKGRKDRYVFFGNKMAGLLKRWVNYKDVLVETNIMFPTMRTTNYITVTNFERNFKIYLKRAKINKNITPHSLRNNFGRRFLIAGGNIYTLSKILGHSSVKVTEQHYADLTNKDIKNSYNRFSPLNNMET